MKRSSRRTAVPTPAPVELIHAIEAAIAGTDEPLDLIAFALVMVLKNVLDHLPAEYDKCARHILDGEGMVHVH